MRRAHSRTGSPPRAEPAAERATAAPARHRNGPAALGLGARLGNRALARRLAAARAVRESGGSEPLGPATRARMESHLGEDFGAVRVHRGPQAAAAARARRARAFTAGSHVVFNAGEYAPESAPGGRLLAHELAHVVQQSRGGPSPGAAERRALERQAEAGAARLAIGGGPIRVEGASDVVLMRKDEPGAEAEPAAPAPEEKKPEPVAAPAEESAVSEAAIAPLRRTYEVGDLLSTPIFGAPDPRHPFHHIWPGHTLGALWSDLVSHNLTREQKVEFRLRGTESGAFWAWHFAHLHIWGLGGRAAKPGDVLDFMETTYEYAKALTPLSPASDLILDTLGFTFGVNLEKGYLESDLFEQRLKENASRLVALGIGLQIAWSFAQANREPAEPGELEETDWRRHAGLVLGLANPLLLEKYSTAPGFLVQSPLSIPTHPAFAYRPWAGGPPPSGLTIEHEAASGEGPGFSAKASALLNLRKLSLIGSESDLSPSDLDDLAKERGWQTSVWGSFDLAQPTSKAAAAGALPGGGFKGGVLFGSGGHLIQLEYGQRWTGDSAEELTSQLVKGGWGYSWEKGTVIPRMGFDATFYRWEADDPLAKLTAGGEAGWAQQVTPFGGVDVELGGGHRLGLGGFGSLVFGSREDLGLAAARGDLSYTYLGEKPDGLPQFEVKASYSASRLDPHDPESAVLHGVELKGRYGRVFEGVRLMTGAEEISPERAALLSAEDPQRAQRHTAVFVVGGYLFD